ncbi:MAG: type II toxin-antitoxin system VapC family toxin, partial [Bacteroidota bacterium]
NSSELSSIHKSRIEGEIENGIGISAISCWEVAKKVEIGKMKLDRDIKEWIEMALSYPGIQLVNLSPEVLIESTQLPGNFHKDPADQMIVATARLLDIPLITADSKILNYPHVKLI